MLVVAKNPYANRQPFIMCGGRCYSLRRIPWLTEKPWYGGGGGSGDLLDLAGLDGYLDGHNAGLADLVGQNGDLADLDGQNGGRAELDGQNNDLADAHG